MKLVHMASGLAVAIRWRLAQIKARIFRRQHRLQIVYFSNTTTSYPATECLRYRRIRQKVALPPDAVLTVTLSDRR